MVTKRSDITEITFCNLPWFSLSGYFFQQSQENWLLFRPKVLPFFIPYRFFPHMVLFYPSLLLYFSLRMKCRRRTFPIYISGKHAVRHSTCFIVTKKKQAVGRRCSVEKVFLEISQSSQENTCARVCFLIGLRPSTLFKKETLAHVFSWEFCEISKNTFAEHLWWLLLKNLFLLRYFPRNLRKFSEKFLFGALWRATKWNNNNNNNINRTVKSMQSYQ